MPHHPQEAALVMLLRQCYRSPRCPFASPRYGERPFSAALPSTLRHRLRTDQLHFKRSISRRGLTTASPPTGHEPTNVAILGGGITGLSAAWWLAKSNPKVKITLYESSSRLGGLVRSKHIDSSNGPIIFEQGPRTLRPHSSAGKIAINIAYSLGLADDMLFTSKKSPAAINRFIYYPDHLVKVPSPSYGMLKSAWTVLKEPLFHGCYSALWKEQFAPRRPTSLEDESIGHFLERRTGNKRVVDNITSAVVHGVYAGDVYKLSVKSLMPFMWAMEERCGGLLAALYEGPGTLIGDSDTLYKQPVVEPMQHPELQEKIQNASVYTFKNGMQALPDTIERDLRARKNVEIKLTTQAIKIEQSEDGESVKVLTSNNQPARSYSHIISTLPAHHLNEIVGIPILALIPYTTVMVVNLYYTALNLVPEHGFGYLIPQSVPFAQNPEFALGVVFDSDATPDLDASTGTKLSVMLGGHYWDGWGVDELPTPEQGIQMAERLLERHLKITEKPEKVLATLHKNCIPQYTVGHQQRLEIIHHRLRERYGRRVSVAGAWIDGVGVNDCVMNGGFAAASLGHGFTGLEQALAPKRWVPTKKSV